MSRIFIVEDDPDVRMSIAEILSEEGYEVREFATASETLRELRAGVRPCVVLVDLLMPEMSGQEFLSELHRDSTLKEDPGRHDHRCQNDLYRCRGAPQTV